MQPLSRGTGGWSRVYTRTLHSNTVLGPDCMSHQLSTACVRRDRHYNLHYAHACVRVRVPQSSDSVKLFRKFFRKCSKIRENRPIFNIIYIMRKTIFLRRSIYDFDPPLFLASRCKSQ